MNYRTKTTRPFHDDTGGLPGLILGAKRHLRARDRRSVIDRRLESRALRARYCWRAAHLDILTILIFSLSGLALSLFAIERFPSFGAMIAAIPLM